MSDFKAKCIKFKFGWGSAPNPAAEAYSTPPDLIAGFKVSYFSRRGGERWRGEGEGKERNGVPILQAVGT